MSAELRVAIFSDVHGNLIALDSVLGDVERAGGVDEIWVLGDHAALGPDPVPTIERMASLGRVRCTRGNTDRYVVRGERPRPTVDQAVADPSLVPQLVEIAKSFAWTQGAVTHGGFFGWLEALPLEHRTELPDGTRVLGVHAAPGTDDGDGIHPALADDELRGIAMRARADLVFVGHTHWALDRSIDGIRVVNLGSVSNPYTGDLRASWTLLEASTNRYRLEHKRVAYDVQAAMDRLERVRHPGAPFLLSLLRGEHVPWWQELEGDR